MTPAPISTNRHNYRTTSGYQLDDRRLLLRGGALDGKTWVGVVGIGKRVFCGEGDWVTTGVYLVTAETAMDAEGEASNIAIPAFA